jgi:biopolymer transport protein ExbD
MADLFRTTARQTGAPRAPRQAIRIDFTPMVDLGFLLITFFMLTTVLAKPTLLRMVMPDKPDPRDPGEVVKASKVLTLELGADDRIYYYTGLGDAGIDTTDFSDAGLRRVLLANLDRVADKFGLEAYIDTRTGEQRLGSFLTVIIKPRPESRYANLVDALDEMAICRVRYYTVQ